MDKTVVRCSECGKQLSDELKSEEFISGLQDGLSRIQRLFNKHRKT